VSGCQRREGAGFWLVILEEKDGEGGGKVNCPELRRRLFSLWVRMVRQGEGKRERSLPWNSI